MAGHAGSLSNRLVFHYRGRLRGAFVSIEDYGLLVCFASFVLQQEPKVLPLFGMLHVLKQQHFGFAHGCFPSGQLLEVLFGLNGHLRA